MSALDPVGAAPETRTSPFLVLLFGTCVAPIFWTGQLMLGYWSSAITCYPGDHPVMVRQTGPLSTALLVFDVVALAACLAGALVSWMSWRRSAAEPSHEPFNAGRDRFLAVWGLLSSLWFFFAVLFNVIASVMVPPCVFLNIHSLPVRAAALAVAGLVILAVLAPPLAGIAQQLFAAHMAQHLLLILVAAPLLVLGGVKAKMPPLAGWGLFVAVFLFWHWPAAFQWAADHPGAEFVELGSILAAAFLFWSGVFGDSPVGDGGRALLVMTAAVLTDLPGVVMLFAPRAICTMPAENAARFGLTPLQDQQVAGLLMWVPANLVFFSIAILLFARWMDNSSSSVVTS